ncbi:hypothetical protein L484_010482 [Morus notabilis]|uniref:Thaumatin-like protein n=1 Tax=Morus notabilis TaxID=981085 RepID=W9QX93_9ROSA|nr:hypothetical protein L484_010482 [Morus notabilis]
MAGLAPENGRRPGRQRSELADGRMRIADSTFPRTTLAASSRRENGQDGCGPGPAATSLLIGTARAKLATADGRLQCNGLIGTPPATLVQADQTKPNFYDVSLVDGYNLPVSAPARPATAKCAIKGCTKNLNALCPDELIKGVERRRYAYNSPPPLASCAAKEYVITFCSSTWGGNITVGSDVAR